ncbi:glycosyltransferase family 2 protein [Salipiger sp. HF18]|uniref:glycosyltransferase n=1 Tax=Salipiger sp. HF18 TaxID=2721557 RepID=UPI00142E7629|nr:glycosyltransferase family 2 protein [Salipiger sp. HF18]NIY94772.1 glycosyltransferase family 2 protein [Salipiger sp. HF18]
MVSAAANPPPPVTDGHDAILSRAQFSSVDSAPLRLTRPVAHWIAPQAICVTLLLAMLGTYALHNIPLLERIFPEGDIYLTRYEGSYTIPIRLFMLSFYLGYASAMDGGLSGRIFFGLDLCLTALLTFGIFDLMAALLHLYLELPMHLHMALPISGLAGLLIFSVRILRHGDMPPRDDSPMRKHVHPTQFLVASLTVSLSAGISMTVARMDLPGIAKLRELALLGGIGTGVFLFLPLLFVLLNWVAAFRGIFYPPGRFAPPITVIIPAHNEAHIIDDTIHSLDVAAEHYHNDVTLLVIDNNSSDATPKIVREALLRARRIRGRLLSEPVPGKAHALNRGIAETRTDYVVRIDADTQVTPEALWRVMRHFSNPLVAVAGGQALAPGGGFFDGVRDLEVILKVGLDQVAYGAGDAIIGVPGMFVAYNTQALREAGSFASGMNGEDTDAAIRIAESGRRLVVDPSATFVSEVPRTFSHMREQRMRWFRSLFHVMARNRQHFHLRNLSIRSKLLMPYLLINTARRAIALPFLLFATIFLLMAPDPRSSISVQAVLAFLMGAPMIMVIFAALTMCRFRALLHLPQYLVFRMFRSYLTLESMLSISFQGYQTGVSARRSPGAKATE